MTRRRMLGTATVIALVATLVNLGSGAEATAGGSNGRIAFSSTRSGNEEIYTMTDRGGGVRRLTWTGASDQDPAWSPDGKQIAFVSDRFRRRKEIFLMDQYGYGQRPLTVGDEPTWSPDGRWIAFSRVTRSGDSDIFIVNVRDGRLYNLTRNTAGGDSVAPAWSPDGRWIAYQHNVHGSPHDIYVMRTDGTAKRNLTAFTGDEPHEHAPSWSPSGARMAFYGAGIGCVKFCPGGFSIYVMDADGSDPTALPTGGMVNLAPAWSPDGSRIAYQSDEEIYVMDADGTDLRNLTSHPAEDRNPDWQPVPIDFERPSLGSDARRISNPHYAHPVTFTAESAAFSDEVVGLVKNRSTSACVEPADDDQKLGTGRSGFSRGAIGRAAFPIRATFWYGGLSPVHGGRVSVAVDVQVLAGTNVRIRLYDASGRVVGARGKIAGPAGGTCGYPGSDRARAYLHASSHTTVASAVIDTVEGGRVFVIDQFRVARA